MLWLWLIGYTNSDEVCRTWTNWKETDIVTIIKGSHLARADFEVWKTKHLKHSFFTFSVFKGNLQIEQRCSWNGRRTKLLCYRCFFYWEYRCSNQFHSKSFRENTRIVSRARTDRTVRVGRVMETVKVARFFALLYVAQRVPPRSLSSMRRTRFPAIKMHVRSSIHDHNYVLKEHRAERGLYLHTCDTVRAR